MVLLRLLVVLLVLATGCYAPDVSDCTVTCTSDEECAGGLVCTPRGLCAGEPTACAGASGTPDAGATPRISIRLVIMGDGKLAIDGVGECAPQGGPSGNQCTLQAPAGALTITAIPDESDKPFERWTSLVCAGQGATCQVTLAMDATVSAKFK